MPTIILVRHGETHWNRAKRIQGHYHLPSPLTLKGIGQAQAYGRTIAEMTGGGSGWQVMASPLARAMQTCAILCETANLPFSEAVFDDRLREVGTGDFSGLYKADVERDHPHIFGGDGEQSWYFQCPGGESYADMAARLGAWLGERRPGEKVIVVSHRVATRVLLGLYQGLAPTEALALDVPQDQIFLLSNQKVSRHACG